MGRDMYSTWDVEETPQGWKVCTNVKPEPLAIVVEAIRNQFKREFPALWEQADYFAVEAFEMGETWDMEAQWTAIFWVWGGSEGVYVHLERIKAGQIKHLALVKSLLAGDRGRQWAAATVAALHEITEKGEG